jgi:hypothetical protein
MQFKTTSGSGAAGLGIIGTGLAMALPEAKFIGWALVVAGLFVFAFDIRIERGHIAIGSSKSLRKRMLAIWPQLLMGVSVVGFAVGLAAYLATPPTHGPHNTQSLTPGLSLRMGGTYTTGNV